MEWVEITKNSSDKEKKDFVNTLENTIKDVNIKNPCAITKNDLERHLKHKIEAHAFRYLGKDFEISLGVKYSSSFKMIKVSPLRAFPTTKENLDELINAVVDFLIFYLQSNDEKKGFLPLYWLKGFEKVAFWIKDLTSHIQEICLTKGLNMYLENNMVIFELI